VKKSGFLSFGHWREVPGSQTRSAVDALLQTIELAQAAEEIGFDGAFVRVHHFERQLASPFPLLSAVVGLDIHVGSVSAVGGPVPVGSMFGLGWLMAELFDPRRQQSVTERQPLFNPEVQLPLVAELDPADRLNFLVADLGDLLTPYEQLSNEAVRAEADKQKPGSAEPFDSGRFNAAVTSLHQAILDQLTDQRADCST
jgi:hypothetical protein